MLNTLKKIKTMDELTTFTLEKVEEEDADKWIKKQKKKYPHP